MKTTYRKLLLALLFVPMFAVLGAMQANAAALTLKLQRNTLNNVPDAAGLWQHEGGTVTTASGAAWGHYAITRRVTTGGTAVQNTAMVTVTLFRNGANPPENMTLQGSHDFSSGKYIGSVSAASRLFASRRLHLFAGNSGTDTLTIQ